MSNIIDKIQLSGVTYTIGGGGGGTGGTAVEEMTQAQYDAAATAGTLDDETLYIITDAEEINANDYVTKASNVASGLTVTVERTGTYNNLQNVKDVYISADTNCSMVSVYFNSNYFGMTITFDFQTTPSFGYDYMRVDFDSENRTYHVWSTDTNLFFYYVYAQYYEGSETFKLWVYTWQIPSGQTASVLNNALPEIASVIDVAKNTLIENINFTTNTGLNYWVYNLKKGGTEYGYTWQVCDGKEIVNKDGLKLGNIPTQTVYSSELLNVSTCEYYPLGPNWVDYPNAIQHFVLKFNYNFYDNTEFSLQIVYYFNSGSGSSSKYIYGRCNNGTIELHFGDINWSSDYAALTSSIQNDTNLDITITSDGIEYVKGTGGTEWISYLYCGNCLYYGSNHQDSPFSSMTEYKNSIGIYDAVETLFGNFEDGKYVETSAITSAVTSASTDSEIPTAKAVWNVASQGGGGGGTTYSAGTNIDITNDTINCTLPIKTNAWNSLTFNSSRNPLQVLYASAFGDYTTASGKGSFSIGKDTTASGDYSFVGGYNYSQAKGSESFSFGDGTVANKNASVAFGRNITTNNECEFSCGKLNKSVSASTTFGNSGNTLFSVGNGISSYHNAFEIRQNGDIYFNDGTNDVKLQDKFTSIETTIGDINTILQSI